MQCEYCNKSFSNKSNLTRHVREYCIQSGASTCKKQKLESKSPKMCDNCGQHYSTNFNLNRHIQNYCPVLKSKCKRNEQPSTSKHIQNYCPVLKNECNRNEQPSTSKQVAQPSTHCRQRLNRSVIDETIDGVTKLQHSFKNRIATYRFTSPNTHINYTNFFEEVKEKVFDVITKYLNDHINLKINLEVFGFYVIPEKELSDVKSFNTANKVITVSTDLEKIYGEFGEEMKTQASEFEEKDSGWILKYIMFLDVNINKYSAIAASSYIKLPKSINWKNAILNIRNNDNACFAWSVNAAIFPANGHEEITSSYPHYNTLLNFEGLDFPMKLKDISKFEKLNNISINVFGLESEFRDGKMLTEVVGPLHFTSCHKPTHVNLLLIYDDSNHHYCLIKSLSRLVSKQKSDCNGAIHICDGCLQSFRKDWQLKLHEKNDCNHTYTVIPSTDLKINKYGEKVPENILKFTNFEKQLLVPFVIYADFESLLKPIDHNHPCNDKSFTVKVSEHQPYSFGFYLKCTFDDRYSKFVTYRGSDADQVFMQKLDESVHNVYNCHLKHVKKMTPLSNQEKTEFENAFCCHICKKHFDSHDLKVRDHCHLTGQYRGAAHSICNLNYKVPKFIPVFFHNLTNYDCHLFIKKLALKKETVSAIAQTKEKYISFYKSILVEKSEDPQVCDTYLKLKFVDSFRFLDKSLDYLSKSLTSEQCIETRKYFQNDEQFELIKQKGVFPYNYVDSFEKLQDEQIPLQKHFYNELTKESLSDKDYSRANKVWNTFNCKTLGDYADIYLKSDVLLLADVFENFRKVCLKQYKLDPCNYLTAPSLSWDAMLRYTGIELELLTDLDSIHFFRKGIRGGVAQCSKRKAVANNKFVPNFDPAKPTSYIIYLDATNLYGAAMKQFLPTGRFRWLENLEIQNFDVLSVVDDSPNGFVLEVDLEYPTHLHDNHNDLPLGPESIVPSNGKTAKLIPNLHNKTKYVIHYRNLKQYLKYGLKLTKIHRILEFSQSPWLGSYIDINTGLRNASRNNFEKDFFKLMVNSIFGKTMENVDKRQNIKLCSCWENKKGMKGARHLIALPYFKSCSVFDENLVAVQLSKLKVVYDKPLYVGFSILDISKTIIYDFLYGYIKPKYGDNATVLYTDTDSLILELFAGNPYEDMKENINYFDTSNYPINNIHNMPITASVVGKMKDEYAGQPIEAFYGTGAKAYCVQARDILKKAKGVSKAVIKHELDFTDYAEVVENGGIIFRKMQVFTSTLHTIHSELRNKVALSSADDKRYIKADGINTLAWGHVDVTTEKKLDALLLAGYNLLEENQKTDYNVNEQNFNIQGKDFNERKVSIVQQETKRDKGDWEFDIMDWDLSLL